METNLIKIKTPKSFVIKKLESWIEEGKRIRSLEFRNHVDGSIAHSERSKWRNTVRNNFSTIFDAPALRDEFIKALSGEPTPYNANLGYYRTQHVLRVGSGISVLEAILDKIHLNHIDTSQVEDDDLDQEKSDKADYSISKIFIVHGHNEELKQSVARYVEKLGLEAVILHEQPSENNTIIEKFEKYSRVPHAIVLFSEDDAVVSESDGGEKVFRPRQNVILELGFFLGKLGRSQVTGIIKGAPEIPSDYSGIIYIKYAPGNDWKDLLRTELKAAGYTLT